MRKLDTVQWLLFLATLSVIALVIVATAYAYMTFGIMGVGGVLAVALLSTGFTLLFLRVALVTVSEGTVQVVERGGAFRRILHPGSTLLLHPFDRIRKTIKTTEQQYEFVVDGVYGGNSTILKLQVLVCYRIARRKVRGREVADEQAVYRATYDVEDWELATRRQAGYSLRDLLQQTDLRATLFGRLRAPEKALERPYSGLENTLRLLIEQETSRWGVEITRVFIYVQQLVEIEPPGIPSGRGASAPETRLPPPERSTSAQ